MCYFSESNSQGRVFFRFVSKFVHGRLVVVCNTYEATPNAGKDEPEQHVFYHRSLLILTVHNSMILRLSK